MAPRKRKTATVEEKKSFSVYAPISLIKRFDEFMKKHELKSRADALDRLLKSADTGSPVTSHSGAGISKISTTKNSRARKQPMVDEWVEEDIDKLRRALEACKPATDEQWQTVANAVGGSHSWEQCKKYAVSKLRYRVKRTAVVTAPKRTLRSRQARGKALKEIMRDTTDECNDVFTENQQMLPQNKLFTVNGLDISCLNMSASGVSYSSRFDSSSLNSSSLDSSSVCTTPAMPFTDLKNEVGSEARKRANRCMNKLQPLLDKAHSMKTSRRICSPKRTPKRKRPRPSHVPWGKLQSNSVDDGETDEDNSYFCDN